jgi:hypothetical protein
MANAYPTANKTEIFRVVSLMNPHRSTSSIIALSLGGSGEGDGNGLGGTLSIAEEKMESKAEEECASLRLDRERNDWSLFALRPDKFRLEPFLQGGVDWIGESWGVDEFGVREA